MSDSLALSWNRLLQPFQVNPTDARSVFLELVAAYSSPHRFYHTLAHVQQVLETVEKLHSRSAIACHFAAIEFAAWFHDAIYDPQRSDNEPKSAEYAAQKLAWLEIPALEINQVQALILSTQTHQTSELEGQILLDADLAILGSMPAAYWNYARQIRQEYAWVSDEAYAAGRIQILQNFLTRSRIYQTPDLFAELEQQARENIEAEIAQLSRHGER